jgi:hypothetical protein
MVISMGCGVYCPSMRIDEDWGIEDPFGEEYEVYKTTAEEIENRVTRKSSLISKPFKLLTGVFLVCLHR